MISVLLVIAAILLLPSYVFLIKSEKALKLQLATIESEFSSEEEKKLSARLETLSKDTEALSSLGEASSVSTVIREALSVARPGITVSDFSYVLSADKNRIVVISGIAATRDALRNYQVALQKAPFARSADLPVSAYAKDSYIPFSITVALKP